MIKKAFISLSSTILLGATAPAAIIGINFATIEQTLATGSYTSTVLGATVTTWNYDGGPGGNDWSGNGTSFSANGQSINIWHDSGATWRNVVEAESSPLHGYLDDGALAQNYIHLTGLSAWLASVGGTAYQFTVLRSSDLATGWDPIEVKTGLVAGETGWLNNNDPTGGTVFSSTIPGFDQGVAQPRTYETPVFTSSANGLALHYLNAGGTGANARGTVAGIIIQSIPEPSSILLGLTGFVLILRRRR